MLWYVFYRFLYLDDVWSSYIGPGAYSSRPCCPKATNGELPVLEGREVWVSCLCLLPGLCHPLGQQYDGSWQGCLLSQAVAVLLGLNQLLLMFHLELNLGVLLPPNLSDHLNPGGEVNYSPQLFWCWTPIDLMSERPLKLCFTWVLAKTVTTLCL